VSDSSTTMTGYGIRSGLACVPLVRMTPYGPAEYRGGTAHLRDDKTGVRSGSAAEAPSAHARPLRMSDAFIAATGEGQEA
jgi:hypothetical protein